MMICSFYCIFTLIHRFIQGFITYFLVEGCINTDVDHLFSSIFVYE